MGVFSVWRGLLRGIDSLVYPQACVVCGKPHEATVVWLCAACAQAVVDTPVHGEFNFDGGDKLPIRAFSGWPFDATIREIIHQLKYEKHFSLGSWFGKMLARRAISQRFLSGDEILVPVPLHPRRLQERGFNQSEEIARGATAEIASVEYKRCLRRRKYTEMQSLLSMVERRENVRDAFAIKNSYRGRFTNRRLVVIDDVFTTGATVSACLRALAVSGATEIRVLTIARA